MARGQSATSLGPGFRFHPTDEELVRYYLRRKVMNKPVRFEPISVVDVYKSEPWDLPGKARLKSRDLEWYFFSVLDKKYSNGSKTNRATEKGYWKTTGKDRTIRCNSRAVGMKKTLVYHKGRAPMGERSNWVMHEYRLVDDELEKAGVAQDAFVLCRIFQKSGTGPKNGEQYGAPFLEEEWDDYEELSLAPYDGSPSNDTHIETDDLFLNFDAQTSENAPCPFKIGYREEITEVDFKPSFDPSDAEKFNTDFSFDPLFDFSDENDFLNPVKPESNVETSEFVMVEEYLNYFDAENDDLSFGTPELPAIENNAKDEVKVKTEEASCSKETAPVEYEPDTKPSFLKTTSQKLSGIPPSAYASDFPLKGAAALRLQPGQSSTSIHVTAGLIIIETITSTGEIVDWPTGKNRGVGVSYSFDSVVNVPVNKLGAVSWIFLILVWVVMMSVSYRMVCDVTAKM